MGGRCSTKFNKKQLYRKIRSSATAKIVHVVPYKLYIAKNHDLMGYIFIADSMSLASVNLMPMAPKAAVLCDILHNDGHRAESHDQF